MIAVRRTLYFAPEATTALRHIDRARVARVRNVIRQLTETPEALDYWPHPRDPSVYGVSAVSYTHLDVYKRQMSHCCIGT